MESSAGQVPIPGAPRYIEFPAIQPGTLREDGSPILNRWSSTLTKDHDFPGAQVQASLYQSLYLLTSQQAMLYAAGVPNREKMKKAPHVVRVLLLIPAFI